MSFMCRITPWCWVGLEASHYRFTETSLSWNEAKTPIMYELRKAHYPLQQTERHPHATACDSLEIARRG
eukprot:4578232-Amphidinium_carterae.1